MHADKWNAVSYNNSPSLLVTAVELFLEQGHKGASVGSGICEQIMKATANSYVSSYVSIYAGSM